MSVGYILKHYLQPFIAVVQWSREVAHKDALALGVGSHSLQLSFVILLLNLRLSHLRDFNPFKPSLMTGACSSRIGCYKTEMDILLTFQIKKFAQVAHEMRYQRMKERLHTNLSQPAPVSA